MSPCARYRSARSSGYRRGDCAHLRSADFSTTSGSSPCQPASCKSRLPWRKTSSPSSSGILSGVSSSYESSAVSTLQRHSHHERLDGKGYPRGLDAGSIGLDTRILTVCDVYDALVSPRVYRAAWSHEAALALLRDEGGSAFDERCVAALERVLGREQLQPVVPAFQIAAAAV